VPHQRARVVDARKSAQDLRQIRRTDLAGSTRTVAERGQPDLIFALHGEHLSPAQAARKERGAAGGGRPA
jgi:hypothetical protein